MIIIFTKFIAFANKAMEIIVSSIQLQLTKLAYHLSHSELPWLKNTIIDIFLSHYTPNLKEAKQSNPFEYKSFNEFFTRELANNARSIDTNKNTFIAPADGIITQLNKLNNNQLIQAKGLNYSVNDLLATTTDIFTQGFYSTTYLAPYNYHRVHMPLDGTLKKMIHIPGKLASVNLKNCATTPNLFTKNERVVCWFNTEFGDLAVVLVGATLVGSIETIWHGTIRPKGLLHKVTTIEYSQQAIKLSKGELLGWFHYGSTVVTLLANNSDLTDAKIINNPVLYGSKLVTIS